MSLPDMSDTLLEWEEEFKVKTVDSTTVDFKPVGVVNQRSQDLVVQVADKEKLQIGDVDHSLQYLMCHSSDQLRIGEFIEFEGEDHEVVGLNNNGRYGYWEVEAEQRLRPPLEPDFINGEPV